MPGGKLYNSIDSELDDDVEAQTAAPDDLDDFDEEIDEEMSEAEQRINLAGYYRILAKGGIFKDGSEAARIVDAEVRAFARERMALLLNLSSAPKAKVDLPFTEDQINVLQWLADRYVEKARASQNVAPLAPPTQPVAPQVTKPAAPAITPLVPPQNAQRAPAKPQAQRQRKPKEKVNYDLIADGVVFQEDGKHWKFVTNPETGQRLKMGVNLKKQVGAGSAAHRLPMPSNDQMDRISHQQAQHQVTNLPVIETDKTRII